MNTWTPLILGLGIALGVLTQAQGQTQVPEKASLAAPSLEQQRVHIQQQKAQQETRFASEEAACQTKFAVTGCVTDVRRRRREAMADLNRQEQSLNSQQRRAKGGDQLIRLEDKAAQQSDRLAAEATIEVQPPVPNQAASQPGQVRQPKTPKAPKIPVAPLVQPVTAGDKAAEAAKNAEYRALQEKKYNEKIRAAEEYRQKKETELAAKPVKKLAPLPPSPAP